jgi:tetratricopeptide (TPR) repeat protein
VNTGEQGQHERCVGGEGAAAPSGPAIPLFARPAGRARRWLQWLRTASLLLAALIFFGGAGVATRRMQAGDLGTRADRELMYFPSGRFLRALSLGNRTMMADLVWLRGLQYYGHHRLTDQRYDHVGHIFDVTTRLDPYFINAYIFGGLVLAAEGGDVDGALEFMKRGLCHNPDSYLLAFEIGFLYHVERRDYARAAYFYRRALRAPGCPDHVRRFAAFACERVELNEEALELWQEMMSTSTHPALRQLAEQRAARIQEALARDGAATGSGATGSGRGAGGTAEAGSRGRAVD